MEKITTTTGEKIRIARTKAGLSQEELANRLDVTRSLIGQYERGVRNPKPSTIQRIADALGIPFTELLPVDAIKQLPPAQLGTNLAEVGTDINVGSNDTVSRQAAMELLLTALCDGWDLDYAEERVQSLPPTSPDMSGYSRRLWKAAYERGKAEGQRTGKWIKPTFIQNRAFDIVHCSECGGVPCGVDENTHYCPNCGVKMEGSTE